MLLKSLILIPLIGSLFIFVFSNTNILTYAINFIYPKNIEYNYNLFSNKLLYLSAMFFSILEMYISLYILLLFNNNNNEFQFRDFINIGEFKISIGIDGISLSLILITALIMPIVFLIAYNSSNNYTLKDSILLITIILLLESILMFLFISLDILSFYILFELILIPMTIIIGKFGSRTARIEAVYRFFLYTLMGSLIMLLGLIFMYITFGTTNFDILYYDIIYNVNLFSQFNGTANFNYLPSFAIIIFLLWLSLFFSFMVKIPIYPFHTWLPEAHTEAPTIGSVILAALLLKLGTYGFLRFSFGLFESINDYFSPLIFTLAIISIIYGSLITLRSVDLKKIIAYSSIIHMNIAIIGLFSLHIESIQGSIYLMISHAFVSSALFILIGILYKRYGTRTITYYKGLTLTMPLFSTFFLLNTFGNMSVPTTASFVGESLLLFGTFKNNPYIAFVVGLGIILSAAYAIWLANRILFGSLTPFLNKFLDLSLDEFLSLIPLTLLSFFFGFIPNPILQLVYLSALKLSIA